MGQTIIAAMARCTDHRTVKKVRVTRTGHGLHDYGKPSSDTYGHTFYIRESSAACIPHVWLFTTPSHQMPGEVGIALHLNEEQARYLARCLQTWIDEIHKRVAEGKA